MAGDVSASIPINDTNGIRVCSFYKTAFLNLGKPSINANEIIANSQSPHTTARKNIGIF